MKRESKNPLTRQALQALREAVGGVVEEHRRDHRPLAVWHNGKAALVFPQAPSVVRESVAYYQTKGGKSRT